MLCASHEISDLAVTEQMLTIIGIDLIEIIRVCAFKWLEPVSGLQIICAQNQIVSQLFEHRLKMIIVFGQKQSLLNNF